MIGISEKTIEEILACLRSGPLDKEAIMAATYIGSWTFDEAAAALRKDGRLLSFEGWGAIGDRVYYVDPAHLQRAKILACEKAAEDRRQQANMLLRKANYLFGCAKDFDTEADRLRSQG